VRAGFGRITRVRVVVAGSSGLIGTALVAGLRESGHEVLRLVRRAPSAPDERGWDPPSGRIDPGALEGADAVVGLGGVGLADRPWSGARRQAIRDSRIVPTEVLAQAVAQAGVPALVSGSAVGFYGDAGQEEVDESAPAGSGFLAEVCRDWEAATATAVEAGSRVVTARTGLVLSPAGGMLALMRPVWKSFLGAQIGDGRQYMPWVSLDDEIAGLRFAIENTQLSGPVNLSGPTPVTNAAFTRALAGALRRPAPLVVPAVVVSTVLGDMGRETLLYSNRAVPRKLLDAGFAFRHATLADALSAVVP
jgi:uncharacterized protein (TIGR01777 family)